jgi:hypothetical protein
MKTKTIKNLIFCLLLVCATAFTTCQFTESPKLPSTTEQDTIFLSQWRREKQEKLERIAFYEKEIYRLQHDNDSMQVLVTETKTALSAYRFKAKHFQEQLKEAIHTVVKKDTSTIDTISPILDSLIISQHQSDASCDTTISILEKIVAKKDSTISDYARIEVNLRDINRQEELRTQQLTDQLNLANKVIKKKTRKNKILAAGFCILSGVASTLLITHSLQER